MSLSKEQTRFTRYGEIYIGGEKSFDGFAFSLPQGATSPTQSGAAQKIMATRKMKHGQSAMSPEAEARAKAQSGNPNKQKKKSNGSSN